METFTMTRLFVCVMAMFVLVHGKPTAQPDKFEETSSVVSRPQDDENDDSLLVVPYEEVEVVPVEVVTEKKEDGEIMDTANARYYSDYYFRPVYTIRRTQSNRRRVYAPRRRYPYDDGDRFPTVA